MTKRLLIDASHAEETRVVVLDGNRLEDFDVETLSRRQLKGNIYLAKVVRVEPSLQAAFVEYGGNRHGFLALGEIHPDYYQIPVADRQRLLEMQEDEARAEEAEDEAVASGEPAHGEPADLLGDTVDEPVLAAAPAGTAEGEPGLPLDLPEAVPAQLLVIETDTLAGEADAMPEAGDPVGGEVQDGDASPEAAGLGADEAPEALEPAAEHADGSDGQLDFGRVRQVEAADGPAPETLGGGDAEVIEEARPSRPPSRYLRNYKIQEVIRRRQIMLVQVVKEERGTKGAALTTYISLAGRYCVLMPNSPRGGGISRKITAAADRRRLKEVTAELDLPRGMGLIVRTAGAARPKAEIMRDGEYLLRLWDDIREKTLASMAPALIHEEASLIKRAIRDVYSRDVEELVVDGEDGWRAARDYMRTLIPTHAKKVQLWPASAQPLFAHNHVESMLDAMLNPVVQLRSGGYLVINQTEALVAIDVNSGRSTRERGIEETALRTNLEAADEAARQLRLRDLAGLVVIDFIDMESKRHNAMVERRMADALKHDRARIQIGHISHFGLLELSRQRLRPSLAETSLNVCAACGGSGHVRSTESAALHVLREVEEEGSKRRAAEILVHVAAATALYILNNKRGRLTEIEARYGMRVCFAGDETLSASQARIERLRAAVPPEVPASPPPHAARAAAPDDEVEAAEGDDEVAMPQSRVEAGASAAETVGDGDDSDAEGDAVPGETAAEGEQRRRKRRRRRRGGQREDGVAAGSATPMPADAEQPDLPAIGEASADAVAVPGHDGAGEAREAVEADTAADGPAGDGEADGARAKRGRRGGRRRRKPGEDPGATAPADGRNAAPAVPAYAGPTPADPFAASGLDIFEVLEQAESHPVMRPQEVEAPPASEEPVAGPAVQPILIGSGEPAAERKRGWWRR